MTLLGNKEGRLFFPQTTPQIHFFPTEAVNSLSRERERNTPFSILFIQKGCEAESCRKLNEKVSEGASGPMHGKSSRAHEIDGSKEEEK